DGGLRHEKVRAWWNAAGYVLGGNARESKALVGGLEVGPLRVPTRISAGIACDSATAPGRHPGTVVPRSASDIHGANVAQFIVNRRPRKRDPEQIGQRSARRSAARQGVPMFSERHAAKISNREPRIDAVIRELIVD